MLLSDTFFRCCIPDVIAHDISKTQPPFNDVFTDRFYSIYVYKGLKQPKRFLIPNVRFPFKWGGRLP